MSLVHVPLCMYICMPYVHICIYVMYICLYITVYVYVCICICICLFFCARVSFLLVCARACAFCMRLLINCTRGLFNHRGHPVVFTFRQTKINTFLCALIFAGNNFLSFAILDGEGK